MPVDLRLKPAERRARTAGCAAVVGEPLEGLLDAGAPVAGTHDLDATAIVVHTSGTTSGPRAVELTYGNWLWSALGSAAALGVARDDAWLCTLPLSHVGGLSILVRSAIYATSVVLHERFDAEAAADEIATRATLVSVVPTTLARLLDAGLRHPPRLRAALVGGAPITAALLERAAAAGVPTVSTYGLTEACSQVTTGGPPLFCTRVRIGHAREILVAGPTVAPGALHDDGWLHTGDEGTLDDDGNLTVTGRAGDTIITGGENVAPAEVEAVLESHPAVAEAAVHGVARPGVGRARGRNGRPRGRADRNRGRATGLLSCPTRGIQDAQGLQVFSRVAEDGLREAVAPIFGGMNVKPGPSFVVHRRRRGGGAGRSRRGERGDLHHQDR